MMRESGLQEPIGSFSNPVQLGKGEPNREECLRAAGLDVEYIRGEGDCLYYENDKGHGIKVLDWVGGYGASFFGHNHPRLVAVLQRLLEERRPFNSQGSIRGFTKAFKARLSRMVEAETRREYRVFLESTGSGAVEAALKHAELEFQMRYNRAVSQLLEVQKRVRIAQRGGALEVSDEARRVVLSTLGDSIGSSPELLIEASLNQLSKVTESAPLVVALEGGFHGNGIGALSLTANPYYREPWRRLGFRTTFVAKGDTAALDATIENARVEYIEWGLDGERLTARPASLVNVIAAFVEPIQGEGGVFEVPRRFLEVMRDRATRGGFPLVFDEIQSGMGRTGTLLASSTTGVVADYVLLSKALGGGLCKVSALLVDRDRYLSNFDRLHSSTFANDDHSSAVGCEALALLEADKGALMVRCAALGTELKGRLRALQQRYPAEIFGVRGRGLLLGVELAPRKDTRSAFLRWSCEEGLLGYVVAGYLLREHGIRIAPTLSHPNTLRIQPSVYVTPEAIDMFCGAFEAALRLLARGDSGALLSHLVGRSLGPKRQHRALRKPIHLTPRSQTRSVAFLAHLLEPQDARTFDESLEAYSAKECDQLLGRISPLLRPSVLHRTSLRSSNGTELGLSVIGIPFTSAQIMNAFRARDGDKIKASIFQAVGVARREGASVIGLGGYTSIVTRSCLDVVEDGVLITSGNSLTAAAAIDGTLKRMRALGLSNRRLGVVGAAGNLGCVIAEMMVLGMNSLLLVGREGAQRRLERRAKQIRMALGKKCPPIEVSTEMSHLASCDIIMTATNAPVPVIFPHHLSHEPTVLCDIAAPGDVDASVFEERPETMVLKGGLVTLPGEQDLAIPGMNPPPGHLYGCLAETLLLGLDNASKSPSVGMLTSEGIRTCVDLAARHGFRFEPFSKAGNLEAEAELALRTGFKAA